MVKDMAIHLESKHTFILPPPIGKKWMSQFPKRHSGLALKLRTRLERQRAQANDLDFSIHKYSISMKARL
ncbi:hypothetical protein HOY80DRAFT_1045391 [Tuber brumale]|nr:hypothetical protein HOY80DRAFT_1045391 [Tuber brumale]